MQKSLKNPLFSSGDWLAALPVEMIAEEPPGLEDYLHAENEESHEHSRELKLPNVIGILPIRNVVAFPGTVTPLAIGRKEAKPCSPTPSPMNPS